MNYERTKMWVERFRGELQNLHPQDELDHLLLRALRSLYCELIDLLVEADRPKIAEHFGVGGIEIDWVDSIAPMDELMREKCDPGWWWHSISDGYRLRLGSDVEEVLKLPKTFLQGV